MSFKKWLEAQVDPHKTVDMPDWGLDDPDKTVIGHHPRDSSNSTLANIEQILRPLDVPEERGFSGTPDYAAPESFLSADPRQPDVYQIFLRDLSQLFPNQEPLTAKTLDNWMLFKSEMLRRLGKRQYMNSDKPRYPIHYALPLTVLRSATQAFGQVKQLLSRDNDPALENIKHLFGRLHAQHALLKKSTENSLVAWLKQTRENPDSYTNVRARRYPAA